MAGFISEIYKNAQVLNYHKRSIDIAGNNLANINNEDYARQQILTRDGFMYTTKAGLQSNGLDSGGLEHVRNQLLDKQILKEISNLSSLQAQDEVLSRVSAVIAEDIKRALDPQTLESALEGDVETGTITKSIDEFFNAWQELSADPTAEAAKQSLFGKAEALISTLNTTGTKITELETFIASLTAQDNNKIDALLQKVAALNIEIAKIEFKGDGMAATLRDEREAALEQLAQYVDVTFTEIADSGGKFTVTAGSTPITLIDATGAVAGTAATLLATTTSLQGGRIHGYDQVSSSGALGTLKTSLNNLVSQLVTSVNAVYKSGTNTGNFFNSANSTMSTIALDSTLTSATSITTTGVSGAGAGANDLALAVAELHNKQFSTTTGDLFSGTFIEHVTTSVATLGSEHNIIKDKIESVDLILSNLKEQRQQESGVSIDQEVAELMGYQRAFQATSRVINILDSMLDVVVNGLVKA